MLPACSLSQLVPCYATLSERFCVKLLYDGQIAHPESFSDGVPAFAVDGLYTVVAQVGYGVDDKIAIALSLCTDNVLVSEVAL